MATPNRASVAETVGDRHQAAELGAVLREMRLAHGRTPADVAADLRIRQVYIQAMEEGRFDDLPGPTYAVGFVRAYADYLGLDVDEVVNRFKATVGDINTPASLVSPSPVAEGRMPTGPVMLFAAVLAAAAYGGWYYLSSDRDITANSIARLPERIARLVGMEGEPEKPAPAPAAAVVSQPPDAQPPTEATKPDAQPVALAQSAASENAEVDPAPSAATEPAEPASPAGEEAPSKRIAEAVPPQPAAESADLAVAAQVAVAEPVPAEPQPAALPDAEPATGSNSGPAREAPVPEARVSEPAPQPAAEPAPQPVAVTPEPTTETASAAPEPMQPAPMPQAEPEPAPEPAPMPAAAAPAAQAPAAEPPVAEPPVAQPMRTAVVAELARPAPTAEPAAASRVLLRANAAVWIEVRDGADKRILSRVLRAGETFTVPARPGLTLTTGNAGGIDIMVDGKAIPPLGPKGAVRRDIALDAGALLSGTH